MPRRPTSEESGVLDKVAHLEFNPDWALSPGALLRTQLDALGMTQTDLADRMKLTQKHVSQVMTGTASLTPEVAQAFERALDVPARTLLLAEARYQAEQSRLNASKELAKHQAWAQRFPLAELRSKGVLQGSERDGELVDRLLRFFGVANPDAFEKVSLAGISGFRRAQHLKVNVYATASWLRLGERQTAAHRLPPFDSRGLRRSAPDLRRLSNHPDATAFLEVRHILADCGVALAFVDGIRESRACGATRWVTPTRPLIVLSDRYGFRDTMWFSLMHEIGHVLNHPRRRTFVNLSDEGDDTDGLEREANSFAADLLVPEPVRQRLVSAAIPGDFAALAHEADVDVSILAGRRGHLTDEWSKVQKLRKKLDVPAIARAAITQLPEDLAG